MFKLNVKIHVYLAIHSQQLRENVKFKHVKYYLSVFEISGGPMTHEQ